MSREDYEQIWANLPFPAFLLDGDDKVSQANSAGEQIVKISARQFQGRTVAEVFGANSLIADTVRQARSKSGSLTQYHVEVALGGATPISCNVHVGPLDSTADSVLLIIQPTGAAQKMGRSHTYMVAARSVEAMSAMLAHELRNPLAGISGAAQLLAMNATDEDRELTELIEAETRRIGKLIDKVEHFGDNRPIERSSVNIHDVLDRAIRSAQAGFASHVTFCVKYDPSLPDAAGDSDQLLQVFQNLLKNSAEAVEQSGGLIQVRTSYNSGMMVSVGAKRTENVPLQIEVVDNGRGITDMMIADIFDPFVTSKANGSGLGLPLVSKIMSSHGGLVECDSVEGRTMFTLRLPVWQTNREVH